MRRLLQVVLTATALLITAALAQVPYRTNATQSALLRLSWRTRGEAAQQCRNRTQAELDALPAHMRTPQVCTGKVADYRLELEVDEVHYPTVQLRAAGAHADRPIYVFKEIELTPGKHEIDVEFYSTLRQDHRLRLEQSFEVRSGDIVLVTSDQETGQLVIRR